MEIQYESLIAALIVASAYLVGGWARGTKAAEQFWARRRYISAAAGISVAYVFIDVLPELELQRKVVVKAAADPGPLFTEQGIYLLTLISFVVMYGLQHMVLVNRERRRETIAAGGTDLVYWLQLAGYAAYSALIGYLLVDRVERGLVAIAAYTIAMAVHFLIVNHALVEEHGASYGPRGRWLLVGSVMAGWCVAVVAPLSETMVARLFALLAGGVVITSLGAELPDDREGRFWPFSLGALIFAAFLLLA
jgi:hypothetical protein